MKYYINFNIETINLYNLKTLTTNTTIKLFFLKKKLWCSNRLNLLLLNPSLDTKSGESTMAMVFIALTH